MYGERRIPMVGEGFVCTRERRNHDDASGSQVNR